MTYPHSLIQHHQRPQVWVFPLNSEFLGSLSSRVATSPVYGVLGEGGGVAGVVGDTVGEGVTEGVGEGVEVGGGLLGVKLAKILGGKLGVGRIDFLGLARGWGTLGVLGILNFLISDLRADLAGGRRGRRIRIRIRCG